MSKEDLKTKLAVILIILFHVICKFENSSLFLIKPNERKMFDV
jgi:hypothetical protein